MLHKRRFKKFKIGLITLIVIMLAISLYVILKPSEMTFEKGFHKILSYDERYNASFKFERLNKTMVDMNNIDPFVEDLERLKLKLMNYENTLDVQALMTLTDTRINMLMSEKYFHLGRNIGDIGIAAGGFRCSEQP